MKKKIKIAILIDRLNVGGVEKIALEEVIALRKQKQDAYLVILRKQAVVDNAFSELVKKVPIIYLDDRLPSLLRYSFKFPIFNFFSFFHISYPFLIPFFIRKREFDYIIVHGTYTAFTAVALKKIKKIKYSVFLWDPVGYILKRVYSRKLSVFINFFIRLANFLDKLIIDNADVILVGGNAHNKYIKNINSKVKIQVIPPSVHTVSKITKIKENYVLMVTAWKQGKNPEYIFKIIKEIPKIKIKMVGRWLEKQYRKDFEIKIKENKFSGNIDIIGEVTEKQLNKYYSRARVLLQTNDDRGFGMPALEAAGHGTTFIIPKGQGVCSIFIDGLDGFYTKELDTKSIVKYLNLLNNSKVLAIKMGEKAFRAVQNKYTWRIHSQCLIKISEFYVK